MDKSVLITGGAGGLGRATAARLASSGWTVFAADLPGAALDSVGELGHVEPIPIDVTDRTSVAAAADRVSSTTDGLGGVVNFAGIAMIGSMIEVQEATLARLMDINVMGTYRVNKAFFPHIKAGKGRIINISSETGHQGGAPFNGAYAMSKHAIEAYTDSLRRELMFLGIPVIKVQPGPFRTAMVESIEANFDAAIVDSENFAAILERVKGMAKNEQDNAHDPADLAAVIEDALTTDRPRAAYSVRPDKRRLLLDKLPTSVSDAILKRVLGG
jgi:NAD(P)-dependent dehydrogenase (short-subunit alcohol dehydrogenase family)